MKKKYIFYNLVTLYYFLQTKKQRLFGIVQLEALASGRPVVNFNLPTGVPSVGLDGKTGLTLDVDDYEAIGDLLAGRGGYNEGWESNPRYSDM